MSLTPVQVIEKFLQNTQNPSVIKELVAPDATYMSLTFSNPELKAILPYSGIQENGGPNAVISVFSTVNRIWEIQDFKVEALFGDGEDVAVFGSMSYKSRTLGKEFTSPFSIWAKVRGEQVTYMRFLEDTLLSTASFRREGGGTYVVDPDTKKEVKV